MPIESDGHSRGNPRLYELIEDAPSFGGGLDTAMILGMAKLKEGVTILLDIDRLMHTNEMVHLTDAM